MTAPARGALRVLFATQTGTAQDVAERIARAALLRRFAVSVSSLDECDAATLASDEVLTVFVVSTTGDGNFPDSSRPFWLGLLRRDLPPAFLCSLRFTVFGLGDSGYAKFNAAARKLCTRLSQLRATSFFPRCLADEQSPLGLEGDLDAWLQGLFKHLDGEFPLPAGLAVSDKSLLVRSRYAVLPALLDGVAARSASAVGTEAPTGTALHGNIDASQAVGCDTQAGGSAAAAAAAGDTLCWPWEERPGGDGATPDAYPRTTRAPLQPFCAPVLVNRRLTAPGWRQDVRHLEIDVSGYVGSGPGVPARSPGPAPAETLLALGPYAAGDVATVFPSNATCGRTSLDALARRIGVTLSDRVCVFARESADPASALARHEFSSCVFCCHARCACAASSTGTQLLGAAGADECSRCGKPPFCPYDSEAFDAAAEAAPFSPAAHFPSGSLTVEQLLCQWLDVLGRPRRTCLEQLAFFATDPEQAEKLRELAAPEGADLYHSYITRERRTFADVLCDFMSVRLPLAYLLELVPQLAPRHFSIASSPAAHPGRVHLCVAVVEYTTPLGRAKAGVCSSWLAGLRPGVDSVPLLLRRGSFRLPQNLATPVVMIGPGTGVAPLRALLQERAAAVAAAEGSTAAERSTAAAAATVVPGGAAAATSPSAVPAARAGPPLPGGCALFFGCRHPAQDWLYHEEFDGLRAAGVLGLYATGFSLAPPTPKTYVQALLLRHGAALFRWIAEAGAHIFISGSAKRMPADVIQALAEVLQAHGDASAAEAAAYIGAMERAGRLVIEAWS